MNNMCLHPEDCLALLKELTATKLEKLSNTIREVGIDGVRYLTLDPRDISYEFKKMKYLSLRSDISCPIYRGHMNHKWVLQSTAERDLKNGVETRIINYAALCRLKHMLNDSKEFLKYNTITINGNERYTIPLKYDLEPFAQHYGFSTMCVDWTMDPEVAMFFACTDGNLNGCTPLSEIAEDIELSSILVGNYRHIDEDSRDGPHIICPNILQRSLAQKGFVSRNDSVKYSKYDMQIDPSYCCEIAKRFNYGKRLIDLSNNIALTDAMQIIRNLNYFPEECMHDLCNKLKIEYPDIIEIINDSGLIIEKWQYIKPKMPDLQSILKNKVNTIIDDYTTITNRCMDGYDLTINEAYEFFTTIELTRRIYNGTIDCLYQS